MGHPSPISSIVPNLGDVVEGGSICQSQGWKAKPALIQGMLSSIITNQQSTSPPTEKAENSRALGVLVWRLLSFLGIFSCLFLSFSLLNITHGFPPTRLSPSITVNPGKPYRNLPRACSFVVDFQGFPYKDKPYKYLASSHINYSNNQKGPRCFGIQW